MKYSKELERTTPHKICISSNQERKRKRKSEENITILDFSNQRMYSVSKHPHQPNATSCTTKGPVLCTTNGSNINIEPEPEPDQHHLQFALDTPIENAAEKIMVSTPRIDTIYSSTEKMQLQSNTVDSSTFNKISNTATSKRKRSLSPNSHTHVNNLGRGKYNKTIEKKLRRNDLRHEQYASSKTNHQLLQNTLETNDNIDPQELPIPETCSAAEMNITSDIYSNHSGILLRENKSKGGRNKKELNPIQSRPLPTAPNKLPDVPNCSHCNAKRFYAEPPNFCCGSGTIKLADTEMPAQLVKLYTANTREAIEFRQCVRSYNNMFAFTSIGVNQEKDSNRRERGIYTFRAQGQIYHRLPKLIPDQGDNGERKGKNVQLYFYDTEHEITNRMAISSKFKESIIKQLQNILDMNPYANLFRRLSNIDNLHEYQIYLKSDTGVDQRTFNYPTVSQVAAMWKESDGKIGDLSKEIRVYTHDGRTQTIKHYFGCYDPLQYPLIFARGETGYHEGIKKLNKHSKQANPKQTCVGETMHHFNQSITADDIINAENRVITDMEKGKIKEPTISCREYYAYKFQMRENDKSNILHVGRLFQQFCVDTYVKIETARLDFFNTHQDRIRAEAYQGILDSITNGLTKGHQVGKRIILPPSFIGGPRDMKKRYMDAMSLVQKYGKPDIFLTMTCNPSWPEIKENLQQNEEAHNRPDLISRVFHAKLQQLKEDVIDNHLFGEVAAYTYVIEFQKRGLPHAHFLIILKDSFKLYSPEQYDQFVSAELPDKNTHPYLYSLVLKHMMHGPCGILNMENSCMKNGKCKFNYPKDFSEFTQHNSNSYPIYMRRNDGKQAEIRNQILDNRWVVPYNPYLLAKYDCHINVEICSTIQAVKYLYKYIYKGHDKILYNLIIKENDSAINEIENYQTARWVCAPEATWRIFSFDLNRMYPSVINLPIHLENYQTLTFDERQLLEAVVNKKNLSKTMLTEFFYMNKYNEKAKELNCLYKEFPQHFVWNPKDKIWTERKKGNMIGRLNSVHPTEGERYYLRLLLMNIRGPTSFKHLKFYNGRLLSSFREAAEKRGLLKSDNMIEETLKEAAMFQMPSTLRQLFAILLIYSVIDNPKKIWNMFEDSLSEDIAQDKKLSKNQIQYKVLQQIHNYLKTMGKSIDQYNFSPLPATTLDNDHNTQEIFSEKTIVVSDEDLATVKMLNRDQKAAYKKIMERIENNKPGLFFIDGPGGTGKTYLYKALLATVRSKGEIALATATSGVAASILPGGRTAHSRFKIPVNQTESASCNISKQSGTAYLIKEAKLIIWDEVTMTNKALIESLDKVLRDIMDTNLPFGGKIIVFGGDFRQTLPVIRKGEKDDCISATLVMSELWPSFERIKLSINMRARLDPAFSNFLLRIGDGEEPSFADSRVTLPSDIILPITDALSPLDSLLNFVYPDLKAFFSDPDSITNRAILTTKNEFVNEINNIMITRFPGTEKRFISINTTIDTKYQDDYEDILQSHNPPSLPPHELVLKKNCPIMLLRNLNPAEGLCNGTRLTCINFSNNVIHARISFGSLSGKEVLIPRIPLNCTEEDTFIPFKRFQFPVRLCFALTINKAQGQTLDRVGLYLKEPVFSHGQLYVALSRAKTADNVKVLITPNKLDSQFENSTRNVVYKEIYKAAENNES